MMRQLRSILGRPALALCALVTACDAGSVPPDPTVSARKAVEWGLPLVISTRTMATLGGLIGVNNLFNQIALSNTSTRFIVAPNQDTLYSAAVIDLRGEPQVLSVPDVTDRYWVYQFLDPWTNTFAYLGTRATHGKGGVFVLTPPGWTGTLPPNTTQIAVPNQQAFLLGRYLVRSPDDTANVAALPRTLQPLSAYLGLPPGPLPPDLPGPVSPTQAVLQDGPQLLDELGDALAVNPPDPVLEGAIPPDVSSIGVGPGAHPWQDVLHRNDATLNHALTEGLASAFAEVTAAGVGSATARAGWTTRLDIGVFHDDLTRAVVAVYVWGANVPEEAVYANSRQDAAGQTYDAAHRYLLHFAAGALPPVDPKLGFWSLTLYGTDMFFVDNALGRYAIGDRTPDLTPNPDGSLDLLVQTDEPAGKRGNWLPAPPSGPFVLIFRMYLPQKPVLDGTYRLPGVQRVD